MRWSILFIASLVPACGWQGALLDHEEEAAAHHPPQSDASALTQGTVDAGLIDPSIAAAIDANTSDIAANTSAIAANAAGISTNATDIAGNAVDIADAMTDLSALGGTVAANSSAIAANAADITQLGDDVVERVSASGDTMSGALVVPELRYSPARSTSVSIPAIGFLGEKPDTEITRFVAPAENGFSTLSGGTLRASARVDVPDGATITDMDVYWADATDLVGIEVSLVEADGGYVTDLATATLSELDEPIFTTTTVSAIGYTVSRTANRYLFLRWTQTGAGNDSVGPGLYVVTLTYTYENP